MLIVGVFYSFVQGHGYPMWWALPSVQSTNRRVRIEEKCAPCFQARPRSSKALDLFSHRWKNWSEEPEDQIFKGLDRETDKKHN